MSRDLTPEEIAINVETQKHIDRVRQFMKLIVMELTGRAVLHDQSKLELPEVAMFLKYTHRLKGMTYTDDKDSEYQQCLKEMRGDALKHHYEHNDHHPEHYEESGVSGVRGMSLVSIIEMLCDWKAASERHDDGNIFRSIKINARRFILSDQLANIFVNTARELWPSDWDESNPVSFPTQKPMEMPETNAREIDMNGVLSVVLTKEEFESLTDWITTAHALQVQADDSDPVIPG